MTAIDRLIEQLLQLDNLTPNQLEILKQAKEMEKQQIIDAFEEDNSEYHDWEKVKLSAEQYYNETFKK